MTRGCSIKLPTLRLVPLTIVALAIGLAACGGPDPEVVETSRATAAPTSVASTTSMATPTDVPTTSESPSGGTDSPTEESEEPDGSTTPKPTIGPEDSGRVLKLTDFRRSEDDSRFKDDNFDVAGKTYEGIGGEVSGCGQGSARPLELRLGLHFKTLTFFLGQDLNNSDDSDQILVARVEGDGEFRKAAKVPLRERRELKVDVTDVAAVQILLYLEEDQKCNYSSSVIGVLMDTKVE